MSKFLRLIVSFIVITASILLILYPDRYVQDSLNAIKLWALTVLPSLLPFFFLTAILTSLNVITKISLKLKPITQLLFRSSGICAYVFFMSIISGYPVGAKLICDLYEHKQIGESEATRMSCLCSTSGPLFIIGSVGVGMFSSKIVGYKLIISHILSAILCGIIFRFYGKSNFYKFNVQNKKTENILYESVYSSVISVLCVGGFIVVFYILAEMLLDFNVLFPLTSFFNLFIKDLSLSNAFCSGLIECTRGCLNLSICVNQKLAVPLACSLISFGGISIIMQSLMYLIRAKVNISVFLTSKLCQMLISFLICLVII